jgi:hypothetical protein
VVWPLHGTPDFGQITGSRGGDAALARTCSRLTPCSRANEFTDGRVGFVVRKELLLGKTPIEYSKIEWLYFLVVRKLQPHGISGDCQLTVLCCKT